MSYRFWKVLSRGLAENVGVVTLVCTRCRSDDLEEVAYKLGPEFMALVELCLRALGIFVALLLEAEGGPIRSSRLGSDDADQRLANSCTPRRYPPAK